MTAFKVQQDSNKRGAFDKVYTPEMAIEPLLPYLARHVVNNQGEFMFSSRFGCVWECTDQGDSAITRALGKYKIPVRGTDKDGGVDFLKDHPGFEYDCIITNPPYSIKDAFIQRCYDLRVPFALLLPITALCGIRRGELYKRYGMNAIVFSRRIDFTGKGAPWFNNVWITGNGFIPGTGHMIIV